MSNSTAIVVFAKPPEPGQVKTRLTDRISPEGAADLYRAFLEDTARMLGDIEMQSRRPACVLAHAGPADHSGFEPFRDEGFARVEQGGGDLGDRLARVVSRLFDEGIERIALLGSDAPTLQPRHLRDGFERLETCDVAIGPAFDGGYYCLQMDVSRTGIFEGIDWSTSRVTEQTLQHCRRAGWEVELGEFWYDIDHFADIERLRYHVFGYLRDGDHFGAPATAAALQRLQRNEGVFALSEYAKMIPLSDS